MVSILLNVKMYYSEWFHYSSKYSNEEIREIQWYILDFYKSLNPPSPPKKEPWTHKAYDRSKVSQIYGHYMIFKNILNENESMFLIMQEKNLLINKTFRIYLCNVSKLQFFSKRILREINISKRNDINWIIVK